MQKHGLKDTQKTEVRVRIDPKDLSKLEAYRVMTSVIVPRPIAWVGTKGADGVPNIAPFSFFNGVSTHPPIVSVSVSRGRKGVLKDTARNILESGELSISVVTLPALQAMHDSSASYLPSESEFEALGISMSSCEQIDAPRPSEAGVVLECKLHQAIDLGSTHLILARVLAYDIRDELMVEGKVDPGLLEPVGRLGGSYAALGQLHQLPRAKRRE